MRINAKWAAYSARLSGAGLTKGVFIYLCFQLGEYLDNTYGTAPWLMMLSLIVGFSLGLTWFIYVATKFKPEE